MKHPIFAAITGVNGYLPSYVLTNQELEKMVETNDEWITTRTGIKERRLEIRPGQGTSSMAIPAVAGLLKNTNTHPEEIDLIICATITPDRITPATANIIAHAVGAHQAFSFDLQAGCSGFLYGLVTGAQFIATGKYKKVVVVGADKMSSIVDYTDRTTCILFGDGAGAVLLEPNYEGYGLVDSVLQGDGAGAAYLYQKAGGSCRPASAETVAAKEHYVFQEGQVVYRHAVEKMTEVVLALMNKHALTQETLKFLVPHQANERILNAVAQRIGLPESQVMYTIHKYGNTTGATIPLCLWEYEKQLTKGDKLLLATFGSGFTWGGAYLTWAYDGAKI